jgi:hypothetical protein
VTAQPKPTKGGWNPRHSYGAHSANVGLAYGALDPATPP